MASNVSFKIYPAENSILEHDKNRISNYTLVLIMYFLIILVFIGTFFYTHLLSGNGVINLLPLIIGIIVFFILNTCKEYFQKKVNAETSNEKAKAESKASADMYSRQLNDILTKSEEIVSKVLPFFEHSTKKIITASKIDISQNALSPFWEKIEEASRLLAMYKEAIDQLTLNSEIYATVLSGKKHTFPTPFPIEVNISSLQPLLDDYNSVIRKAQTITAFATIWEIRRNTSVNIVGFHSIEHAINTMQDSFITSLSNLAYSIKSDSLEMKNLRKEQFISQNLSHEKTNQILREMDNKLYYITYNKGRNTLF